jgi:hypothetical protein
MAGRKKTKAPAAPTVSANAPAGAAAAPATAAPPAKKQRRASAKEDVPLRVEKGEWVLVLLLMWRWWLTHGVRMIQRWRRMR